MKRMIAVCLLAALLLCGCGEKPSAAEKTAKQALEVLEAGWQDLGQATYLCIKDTRVIYFKENAGQVHELFQGLSAMVEFNFYADYYGQTVYPIYVGAYDCVAIYSDGSMELLSKNPIRNYMAVTYKNDYAAFVDRVEELGSVCNKTIQLN